jgi:hypothetical protein
MGKYFTEMNFHSLFLPTIFGLNFLRRPSRTNMASPAFSANWLPSERAKHALSTRRTWAAGGQRVYWALCPLELMSRQSILWLMLRGIKKALPM